MPSHITTTIIKPITEECTDEELHYIQRAVQLIVWANHAVTCPKIKRTRANRLSESVKTDDK